ncbi:zinc finger protein 253-like [Anoplopoma fimbria]|uniref:zinc finger protein 253-like n=1 Tax=Anoplopoma fimbria TaxID=229290 RepID=UPI0023EAFDDB|nr:zinc finger protein 253-like [Anoplopoma fimbria]
MAALTTFKEELRLIVSGLARAVLAAAEEPRNPGTEEKLSTLVNSLCVEAVHQILKMVEPREDLKDPPGYPKDPPGDLKDPPGDPKDPPGDHKDPQGDLKDPAESYRSSECLKKKTEGGEGGGERPLTGQTYILVYGSAAVHSKGLLLSLQGHANANANANGENRTSPPPPQNDVPDHEYARPPPGTASSVEGGVSAARGRKQRCGGRRRKTPDASQTTESPCRCSRCGMLFPTSQRLSDHQRKSHPVCSVCGAVFAGVLRLREHTTKEHGLLPYTCDYCPKRFNHKAHRDLHVKARHTGEKTCHCDVCGKGYSGASTLKTHRTTHFEKTFVCDVCGRSFYHGGHLTRHKLVHREVRPYRCSTCGKGFTQAANLRSHQAVHTGERALCSVCGKSVRCLKSHVLSKHSHELPADELTATDAVFTCEVCGKKFPHPSQFMIHQRSHTGEKPFHCDVCGKSYSMKQQLREHRYTHTGEKPYRCTFCSKTFSLATSFMRHRSIHSGETPYSCSACGKHFRLLTFLKAHLQTKAHLRQTQTVTSDLTSDSLHGQKYVDTPM